MTLGSQMAGADRSEMATTRTGLEHGSTIELEGPVPELEGRRVRVVLEAFDEPRLSTEEQRTAWQAWAGARPAGTIDDGPDTEFP